MTFASLISGIFLLTCFQGQAALPAKSEVTAIDLGVAEILAMPPENRVAVAQARKDLILKDLEQWAFNSEKDYSERWKALVLYLRLAGEAGKATLSKALHAEEWYMRNAALVAAQEMAPREAVTAAKTLLSDRALVVRSAAIEVLKTHLDSEVRELLWDEMAQPRNFRKKQSLWTRPQILGVLAEEPQDRELPLFIAGLREADPRMHEPAVAGLEKLTRQFLGKNGSKLSEKRELWLKWASRGEKENSRL